MFADFKYMVYGRVSSFLCRYVGHKPMAIGKDRDIICARCFELLEEGEK